MKKKKNEGRFVVPERNPWPHLRIDVAVVSSSSEDGSHSESSEEDGSYSESTDAADQE